MQRSERLGGFLGREFQAGFVGHFETRGADVGEGCVGGLADEDFLLFADEERAFEGELVAGDLLGRTEPTKRAAAVDTVGMMKLKRGWSGRDSGPGG